MAAVPGDSAATTPPSVNSRVFRRAFGQASALLLLAAIAALLTAWFRPPPSNDGVRDLTLAQIRSTFANQKILWVDARPSSAFTAEHIPTALWLAEEAWDEGLAGFVEAWSPGQPVVVYCGSASCGASRSVARRLKRELNITEVFYLKGGWQTWKEEAK
jgi:rhodanese-related sulfurtransferase